MSNVSLSLGFPVTTLGGKASSMVVGKGQGYTSACNHCPLDEPGKGPGNALWRETVLAHNCCLQGENKNKQKLEANYFMVTFLLGSFGKGVGTLVSCKEPRDQQEHGSVSGS